MAMKSFTDVRRDILFRKIKNVFKMLKYHFMMLSLLLLNIRVLNDSKFIWPKLFVNYAGFTHNLTKYRVHKPRSTLSLYSDRLGTKLVPFRANSLTVNLKKCLK